MAATIVTHKPSGKFQVLYRKPGVKGPKARQAKLYPTLEAATEARDFLNNRDRTFAEARQGLATGSVLGEHLFPAWIEAHGNWRLGTRTLYKLHVDCYLLPYFGSRDMRALTRTDMKTFGAHLVTPKPEGKGLAVGSCETIFGHIRSALLWAADQKPRLVSLDDISRHIVRDGMSGARSRAPQEKRQKQVQAWSLEERRILLEVASARPHVYAGLFMLFETGMRCGEMFALDWRHIDVNGLKIQIERTLERRRPDMPGPKGERSMQQTKTGLDRTIDMSPALGLYLREMRRAQSKLGLDDEPVLLSHGRERWNERSFDQAWKRIRRRAVEVHGVRPLKLHCTRSTFASIAFMNGAADTLVANQLGDTLATIQKHYATWILDGDRSKLFLTSAPPSARRQTEGE